MTAHISVLHPDNTSTHYDIGSGAEFESWRITPNGLVFYRSDGSRMHILPGSMANFNVYPCKGENVDEYIPTLRPEDAP